MQMNANAVCVLCVRLPYVIHIVVYAVYYAVEYAQGDRALLSMSRF